MKKKLALIFIAILSACSSSENNGSYTKSNKVEDNLSSKIKSPWIKIESEGSDLALRNSKSHSIFIFNSACRKFDSSNLPTLTNSILTGIDNIEVSEKTATTYQERDAILVIAKGSIDGVVRYFRVLTTQKNNCIYDFAIISSTESHLMEDTKHFNNFIQLIKLN